MSYQCNYRILPDFGLVVSSYKGAISELEIIATKEKIRKDETFRMEYNVLDDFSGTEFDITKESFANILQWLKEHFSWDRKSAVIAQTPAQVASILRFDSLNKESLPMNIKIFNTLHAALQWIGIKKEDEPEIEAILKSLRKPG